jgi:hypothetical protein
MNPEVENNDILTPCIPNDNLELTLSDPKVIAINSNPFRNSNNSRYTLSLFYELTGSDKSTVVYTLKEKDHKGYPSLKRLYLEEGDTTEYLFSIKYLDGFEHWQMIATAEWFKPFITQWREELRAKKESDYIRKLEEIAENGGKDRSSAIKTLLERVRKPKEALKRGRPVHPYQEEIKTSVERSKAQETLNDLNRLGIG